MHNQQPQTDQLTLRTASNLLFVAVLSHATVFYPVCRRYFGCEGLGWNGLGAFLVLFILGAADLGVRCYFFIWLALLVGHRIWSVTARWRGYVVHSWSRGEPYLGRMLTQSDSVARWLVEPMICLVCGFLLNYVTRLLGLLVMSTAVSMFVVAALEMFFLQRQLQQMDDLELDFRALARMRRGGE